MNAYGSKHAQRDGQRVAYLSMGLFLFTCAGAIFLIAFGDRLFLTSLDPAPAIVAIHRPVAPRYADTQAWAALPFHDDFADLIPKTVTPVPEAERPADVFFIHTTTHAGNTVWNAAIAAPLAARRVDEGSIKHQASVFAECCRIYAPRYRQASEQAALEATGNDSRRALEIAYQDVDDAFTTYLETWGGDRPFILAGHGQGARHALRLLEERIAGTPLQKRLIAAYLVGLGIPLDHIAATVPTVPVCDSPEDTGCIVGWTSLDEASSDDLYATQSILDPSGVYRANANRQRLCVNPLSWRANEDGVAAAENPGGILFQQGIGAPSRPIAALTGARCQGGTLRVSGENIAAFGHTGRTAGDFHLYDYNLFYMSIRRNAAQRTRAFLAHRSGAVALRDATSP